MKKLSLSHEFTPPSLVETNQALEALLAEDEFDDKTLLDLVNQRDALIQAHLDSLDDEARQSFAEAEIKSNESLREIAQGFFRASLNKLSGLVRGRKAVSKYR